MRTLIQIWFAVPILSLSIVACGPQEPASRLKEAWDFPNNPAVMGGGYEFAWNRLPLSGESQGPRWSGDYWPTYKGGIAQRWQEGSDLNRSVAYSLLDPTEINTLDLANLSPAEKYDIYAGDPNFSLTRFERMRTRALDAIPGTESYRPGFTIASWEGLCHGWAPATMTYQEPDSVTLTNSNGLSIPFYSADVKALLSFVMHESLGSRYQFLGRRCEADFGQLQTDLAAGRIDRQQYEAAVESLSCRDTNAGSFHVVLVNELGRLKKSFIMDVNRDFEVWNQAVVSYRSQAGEVRQQASPGAAPDTMYEVDVETVVTYISEVPSHIRAQGPNYSPMYAQQTYRYRLELNAARSIVGGAWLSQDRPDFLWRQSAPYVSQRLRYLPAIYKAATGVDLLQPGLVPVQPPQPNPVEPEPPFDCVPGNPWCFE